MNFSLSPEQQMLKDSVARLLEREYDAGTKRRIRGAGGHDRALWMLMAENGLMRANFPESAGGFGGAIETMIIMELFGWHLVTEPMVHCAVIPGLILAAAEPGAVRDARLAGLFDGALNASVATMEPGMRSPFELDRVRTSASRVGDEWILSGAKCFVHDAGAADSFLVTARDASEELAVFLIPAAERGLERRTYRTLDGRSSGELRLDSVRAPLAARIINGPRCAQALEFAFDRGTAAACAEAIGSMENLLQATISHAKQREQYGSPLAGFQVLQHRMAEMYVELETARSMGFLAAATVAENGPSRVGDVSAARVQIGRAARFIGQEAVQLHGGMGMAEEAGVAPHFTRLTLFTQLFGDESLHLSRYRQGRSE